MNFLAELLHMVRLSKGFFDARIWALRNVAARIDSREVVHIGEHQETARIEERPPAALACRGADRIVRRQKVDRIEKCQVTVRKQAADRIEKRQAGAHKQVVVRTGKHQEAAGFGIRQVRTCSRNRRKAVGRGLGREAHRPHLVHRTK